MTTHVCDSLVISCIDFRFQKYVQSWLERNMTKNDYDFVGYSGASKDLKAIIKQLDISVRLHHILNVVVIHHEDCGAYGKESTRSKHIKDLKKSWIVISSLYPHLKVFLFYLHLDGKFEKIQ